MRVEANTLLAEGRAKHSAALRIGLLGGFSVTVGNRKVDENAWRLRKAASLVKLLALASGHRLHRERAMDLLWPELGLRAASNNLRQALHVARRKLHPDPQIASRYLSLSGEQLVMCPQGQLWVDVEAFEEAAYTARSSKDPAAYRAAIELYQGSCCQKTATRSGRRAAVKSLGVRFFLFWSSSLDFTRSAGRTRCLPSRLFRGCWRRSPPTRRRTWVSCACTPPQGDREKP